MNFKTLATTLRKDCVIAFSACISMRNRYVTSTPILTTLQPPTPLFLSVGCTMHGYQYIYQKNECALAYAIRRDWNKDGSILYRGCYFDWDYVRSNQFSVGTSAWIDSYTYSDTGSPLVNTAVLLDTKGHLFLRAALSNHTTRFSRPPVGPSFMMATAHVTNKLFPKQNHLYDSISSCALQIIPKKS